MEKYIKQSNKELAIIFGLHLNKLFLVLIFVFLILLSACSSNEQSSNYEFSQLLSSKTSQIEMSNLEMLPTDNNEVILASYNLSENSPIGYTTDLTLFDRSTLMMTPMLIKLNKSNRYVSCQDINDDNYCIRLSLVNDFGLIKMELVRVGEDINTVLYSSETYDYMGYPTLRKNENGLWAVFSNMSYSDSLGNGEYSYTLLKIDNTGVNSIISKSGRINEYYLDDLEYHTNDFSLYTTSNSVIIAQYSKSRTVINVVTNENIVNNYDFETANYKVAIIGSNIVLVNYDSNLDSFIVDSKTNELVSLKTSKKLHKYLIDSSTITPINDFESLIAYYDSDTGLPKYNILSLNDNIIQNEGTIKTSENLVIRGQYDNLIGYSSSGIYTLIGKSY